MNNSALKIRLSLLNFLEFAIWGAYLTSLGNFLFKVGLGAYIGWFYAIQGIVSIFMPSIIGYIADRKIPAQKMLSLCQLIGGLFMGAAGFYCMGAETIEFAPLFTLYTISMAFFMPSIGLNNSVAFSALTAAGEDTVAAFPPIRIWGTIGFICSMLFVNFAGPVGAKFQTSYYQLFTSASLSLMMAAYALTMPACPTSKSDKPATLIDILGLRSFSLFKDKKLAIFFIFSMFLGVSLQITNGYANPYITSFENIPEFANAWAAKNANALISLSQVSETLCILLIPFCLKRFGIKGVMLMSMVAWVLRFGLFGAGNPEITGGLWMFVLSCIVYGVAFDFFNVSGGLYVDKVTPAKNRSSAQGLFMTMTNGLGATMGTIGAMMVVNHYVTDGATPEANLEGWRTCWYIFAAYAAVVAVLFALIFRDNSKKNATDSEEADTNPAGMIEK